MPLTFCELETDDFDPAIGITFDDWRSYRSDFLAMPMDLPSPEEVADMARSLGLDEPPF
jgi:hypothetical protein